MQNETQKTLQRVIEKANKLRNSRFTQQLIENGNKIRFAQEEYEVIKPDDEAVEAFILTFRFFIVQNEATSFRALSKLIDAPDVSEIWKHDFTLARASLNGFLDSNYGTYVVDGNPETPSNREILDTFLYGGLAHANQPAAVARFERWKESPLFDFQQWAFISILQTVLRVILYIAYISDRELKPSNHK